MDEEQVAFNKLKNSIRTTPILGHPDSRRQYILDTDVSGCGVGAMLSQTDHAPFRYFCRRRELSNQVTRWHEILAEFCYILEQRSETRHGNADRLSRQTCEDCGQCVSIEQRDGGPSRKELARKQRPLSTSHGTPTPTVAGLNLGAGGTLEELPAPTGKSGQKGELARLQAIRQGSLAIMNRTIATREEVSAEHLEVRSRRLAILYHMQGSLRIRQDRAGSTRGPAGVPADRWCAICPPAMRETMNMLALPEATASVVAHARDEWVFCYLRLPEQIYIDQGAQFKSQLMAEPCQLWNVEKTHTTPYHLQANGIAVQNNQGLRNSLRALLLA
ncbi:uncharacterized protein [Watersipora subatra]|uniref:uncharacterized protein n=1 Tax=Watersipora subatra TaxID=2589382 RepID=UPI00355BDCC0